MPRPLVLMVDSDSSAAHIRSSVLEVSGYSVRYSEDPGSARSLLKERPVALLYSLERPSKKALQAFRELRIQAHHVPTLALVDSPSATRPDDIADRYVPRIDGPRALLQTLDELVRYKHQVHPELEGDRVVFVDHDRRYVEATESACELIGYTRKELLGKRIEDVSVPQSEIVREKFSNYIREGEQAGVFVLKHKDGQEVAIAYRALVLPDGCMAAQWEPLETL